MASRKRLTAAARRAQLIDVAREVFAEKGYDATSVEEVGNFQFFLPDLYAKER
jgi:AcrR family transcriptional regulator